MALKIDYLGGNCPVQSEGWFDNLEYYFRARGEYWVLELSDPETCKMMMQLKVKYGTSEFAAGWMPRNEAFIIIVENYFKWKRGLDPYRGDEQ